LVFIDILFSRCKRINAESQFIAPTLWDDCRDIGISQPVTASLACHHRDRFL
jgi:hypothetical protein